MPQTKTPRRVRLSRPERRQQLIEAAQGCYLRLGIDGTSMHKVAAAAGVNIATLYQHFASNDELFDAALLTPLESTMQEKLAAAEERLASLTGEDRLTELNRSLMELMQQHGPTLNAIFVARNDAGRRQFNSRTWPALEQWVQRALEGIGPTRAGSVGQSMAAGLSGLYLWLAMHTSYRGEELGQAWSDRISDLLYRGLIGSAGTKE